jgi:hypothetical protein
MLKIVRVPSGPESFGLGSAVDASSCLSIERAKRRTRPKLSASLPLRTWLPSSPKATSKELPQNNRSIGSGTLASIEIDDLCLGRPLRKGRVHTAMPFEIIPKLQCNLFPIRQCQRIAFTNCGASGGRLPSTYRRSGVFSPTSEQTRPNLHAGSSVGEQLGSPPCNGLPETSSISPMRRTMVQQKARCFHSPTRFLILDRSPTERDQIRCWHAS